MIKTLLLSFSALFLLSSCASIPGWVRGPESYEEGQYMYFKGVCAPSYYRQDAEKSAVKNARDELAATRQVRVKNTTVDVLSSGGGASSGNRLNSVTTIETDEVVKLSEPVSVWFDDKGEVRDKGSAFALIRIKKSLMSNYRNNGGE